MLCRVSSSAPSVSVLVPTMKPYYLDFSKAGAASRWVDLESVASITEIFLSDDKKEMWFGIMCKFIETPISVHACGEAIVPSGYSIDGWTRLPITDEKISAFYFAYDAFIRAWKCS